MQKQAIARVNNLTSYYDDFKALDDVTLDLMSGEITAILGPNGAGKTTLINTILGRKRMHKGQVSVFGQTPGAIQAKRQTGAMLQVAGLPDMIRVREHIELFQSYYPAPMPYEQVAEIAGLQSFQDARSSDLSGGQKQRLLFALAICGNPRLLMLDEPTVGMDIMSRRSLWQAIQAIRDEGVCVVLTTHYLEEADRLADRIFMLSQGQIIREGKPADIKRNMAHQTIEFAADVQKDQLTDLQAVVAVNEVDGRHQIASMDSVLTLSDLFNRNIKIDNLTVANASLEEAFVQLAESKQEPLTEQVVQEVVNAN